MSSQDPIHSLTERLWGAALSLLGLVLVINVAWMLLLPVLPVLIVAVVCGAVLRAVVRRQ